MSAELTSDQVWKEIGNRNFAVLGTVNRKGQPRTAGIVYAVRGKELYVGTSRSSAKAKNLGGNPHVSLTVTIDKGIPFLGWLKIPPATITFNGEATLNSPDMVDAGIQKELVGSLKFSEKTRANMVYIQVKPVGHFFTYGFGVSLRTMLRPDDAWARVAV